MIDIPLHPEKLLKKTSIKNKLTISMKINNQNKIQFCDSVRVCQLEGYTPFYINWISQLLFL